MQALEQQPAAPNEAGPGPSPREGVGGEVTGPTYIPSSNTWRQAK